MSDLSKDLKAQQFADLVKERKTIKQLADIHSPLAPNDLNDTVIGFLLEAAHWAPFHKPAHDSHLSEKLDSIVPWRCHMLNATACRSLLQTLKDWSSDDQTWLKGKVPSMLASASSLFIVTCLVNPSEGSEALFEPSFQNMEIIAAASAAIQNLLLAATFSKKEIILGAIFLFNPTNDVSKHEGAWRHKRGETSSWARFIQPSHISKK